MPEPILQFVNVSKRFGGLTAVNNISLVLGEGELRCLIGPNGAGKSTLFRLIIGAYPASEGKILFQGRDLARFASFERSRLGISIKCQTPMVYYDQPLSQNLVIALQKRFPKLEARERAMQICRDFGIADAADKLARDVAHGYRQWLEIGMAVSTEPKLLLLDEPTAGMSAEETARTAGMIQRLRQKGMTIIVIDHDMEFVRMLNCNLTVLHLGSFFAEGSLAEIQANQDVRAIYLGRLKK